MRSPFVAFVYLFLLAYSMPLIAAEDVKIASTGPSLSTLPLEIAARKGFFRDEELEVLTITMRANIAVNALLTKGVEYATPSTSMIKAATAGLPVKTVAVLLGRPDYFLTVRREKNRSKTSGESVSPSGVSAPPPTWPFAPSPNKRV